MSLGEFLRTKSSEYELLAEWHAEWAPLDDQHLAACQAMLVVGIVLMEIAAALKSRSSFRQPALDEEGVCALLNVQARPHGVTKAAPDGYESEDARSRASAALVTAPTSSSRCTASSPRRDRSASGTSGTRSASNRADR